MRVYVECNQSWWVDAESLDAAKDICRDGGGEGHTVEWFADEGVLWLLPDDTEAVVPRD